MSSVSALLWVESSAALCALLPAFAIEDSFNNNDSVALGSIFMDGWFCSKPN